MEGFMRFASRFVAGATLSGLALVPATTFAQELVVAIFGGSFADNTQECAVKPFEAQTGASVQFVLGSSVQTVAKLRAAGDQSGIDVSYMDIQIVKQAKNEDLLGQAHQGRLAVPDISGTAGQQFLIAAARLNGGSLEN